MRLTRIFAQLNCSDLAASEAWFETLFGRPADARPMAGLAEWHHQSAAGFQLFVNPSDAGHGVLTLFVADLGEERSRLDEAGMEVGEITTASTTSLMILADPDANMVVLAEPR